MPTKQTLFQPAIQFIKTYFMIARSFLQGVSDCKPVYSLTGVHFFLLFFKEVKLRILTRGKFTCGVAGRVSQGSHAGRQWWSPEDRQAALARCAVAEAWVAAPPRGRRDGIPREGASALATARASSPGAAPGRPDRVGICVVCNRHDRRVSN